VAISVSGLTQGIGSGTTSYTTASVAPAANRLLLLCVSSFILFGNPNTPTVSGLGLTWTQIRSNAFLFGQVETSLFAALTGGSAPTPGTLSISYGGQTQGNGTWALVEVSGCDLTSIGAAVRQSNAGEGTSTTPATTLAAFGASGNGAVCFVSCGGSVTGTTPGSGWSEIYDGANVGGASSTAAEWRADPDTTPDWTASPSDVWACVACEVAVPVTARVRQTLGRGVLRGVWRGGR
jgi:hypothetical protein